MTPRDFIATALTTAILSLIFKKKAGNFAIWFQNQKLTYAQGIALGIIIVFGPMVLMVIGVKCGIIPIETYNADGSVRSREYAAPR